MSTQRRTSTPSTGGAAPGRDDEYPTDTFDSVVGAEESADDGGWEHFVGAAGPAAPSRAPEDDERPMQVFGAIRDDAPQRPPVAEQLFGGSVVPEEDDTAVFARYRDDLADPRAAQSPPTPGSAPPQEDHTEQFAAYRDEAHSGPDQTLTPALSPFPRGQVPGPMTPPVPPVGDLPRPSGGKRALREPVPSADQVPPDATGQPSAEADDGAQPNAGGGADSPERTPGDESSAEPVLDKKAAKRLAKDRQRADKEAAKAAKEAAKAAKVAAVQAAKAEKVAAKAAKKSGRGRGAEAGASAEAGAVTDEAVTEAAPTADPATRDLATRNPAAGDPVTRDPAASGVVTDEPAEAAVQTAAGTTASPAGVPAGVPAEVATPRRKAPVLVVLLLLFIGVASGAAAWLFSQQAVAASKERPSSNIALLDKKATEEAVSQISKAVEAIYTYDSNTLDQNEASALSQITGSYESEFKDNFAAVRALPAGQRASLTSKVAAAGVITLTERRANVLVMLDQTGRRADNPAPVTSAVRLSVTAQRVDGQWKVSDISQK
jgi:Mce-associated membrane protein